MKKEKKILFILVLVLSLILLSTSVFAATIASEKTVMQLVEDNTCTINMDDLASVERKVANFDATNKQIDLTLKVTANLKEAENLKSEVFLVIDNSQSMGETLASGLTRLQAVTNSAKALASSLMKDTNMKVGIVSFSSGAEEGTITDAKLRLTPSATEADVLLAIDNVANDTTLGTRTNIDAGITLANQNFSVDSGNKYIVLLTDGVPNNSLGTSLSYSGQTAANTKAKLLQIADSDVKIITVMAELIDAVEPTSNKTYKDLAEEIFGTTTTPTVGKYYYVSDSEIENTISTKILEDIKPTTGITSLKNINIYDYFTDEIINNFDFSYVSAPTKGSISDKIDLENKNIKWHLEELKFGESAEVTYRLKAKENIDETILNKVLDTNKKLEVTVDNTFDKNDTSTEKLYNSTVTPKIKLTKQEEKPVNKVDNSIANSIIPQTGSTSAGTISMIVILMITAGIGIRLFIMNRNEK